MVGPSLCALTSAEAVVCLEDAMERVRVVDVVEREVAVSPPSVIVRICKGCGKHYVALMRCKAEEEAMRLSRQALNLIRLDGPDARESMRKLTEEAHLSLFSAEGFCRSCGLRRCAEQRLS